MVTVKCALGAKLHARVHVDLVRHASALCRSQMR
jgi:hypothetical protein